MKKSKSKKTHEKPPLAKSMRAAASITGLPPHVIQGAKGEGCEAFKANGTVNCEELLKWVAEHPSAQNDVPNYFVERALDLRAARRLKEQKLLERQRIMVPVANVKTTWTRNVIAAKNKFQFADAEIAAHAQMKFNLSVGHAAELREIIRIMRRTALKELHVGEWGKTECPHCQKEIKSYE